jgi:hypothetical protein
MDKVAVPKPSITREGLAARLRELGVPNEEYYLYGTREMRHCMDQLPLGKWVVFWSERGGRESERTFGDEGDACQELFTRLRQDGLVPADARLL